MAGLTVRLPKTLLPLFAGLEQTEAASGATVGEALTALDERWPGLLDRLCDPGPVPRRHILLFVDGEPAGLDTTVPEGSRVDVITAITGG